MMVMTAKFNFKKVMMILGAVAAVILALILMLGGNQPEAAPTASAAMDSNEQRIQFLRDLGWEVNPQPVESGKVKIPKDTSSVYERYNNLQKSQGYDLSQFAGKKVMRYVYQVTNEGSASAPIYATMLISGGKMIGGDMTDTGAGGKIWGFKQHKAPRTPAPTQVPETQAPTVSQDFPQ